MTCMTRISNPTVSGSSPDAPSSNPSAIPSTSSLANTYPVTELLCRTKGGTVVCRIDTKHLDRVFGISTDWAAHWDRGARTYYVSTCLSSRVARNDRRRVYLHRVITDAPKGLVVDHLDHDGLNNRESNLRNVTHGENIRNTRRYVSKTGFRGVTWYRPSGKWRARVTVAGKDIHLGHFADKAEAGNAVKKYLVSLGVPEASL